MLILFFVPFVIEPNMSQNLINCCTNDILEQLYQAEYGAHYLLVYPDLKTLREIYPKYVNPQLQDNNELIVILTYYDPPDNIRKILSGQFDAMIKDSPNDNNNAIDVIRKYENEGSLIIMDSLKGYFGLEGNKLRPDKDGIIAFLEQLTKRAESTGKNSVSVFADIGSFYHHVTSNDTNSPADKLVQYELSLPSKYNVKIKGFCIYNKADFEKRITEEQKQKLLNHHGKALMIENQNM